jgi:DNA-binding NtrC family response regulator
MFAVELPLGETRKTATQRQSMGRPLRIALVDDNVGVLNAMVCALEGMGHKVVAASTGQELLRRLGNSPPELVISDYRLEHGQTGFDVIAAARAHFGDKLPALLITGDTDPKLIRSMADRGIAVQHKPLDLAALKICIAQVTDRRQS